eukprot:TRINITY_DN324_c0_g1_i2.p1 TRINITY_DN324_c0_g1~~TRINITY_DN324_c0_g1_i2.p1  ORF type:complete len:378 (+),score=74.91 TRINITY_DN324_c0_g1_i2:271-1404(+)
MNPKNGGRAVFKVERTLRLGKRVLWNKDHDNYLLHLVNLNNGRNWKKIASGMQIAFRNEGLTAKKCRERWSNCADPTVDKGSLSKAEELMLLACHQKCGNKWAIIAQQLPTRNSSKVKNTFSSLIKKVSRKIGLEIYDEEVSPLGYIQEFYMAVVVHDMIRLRDDTKEICRIASEHISKHIENRNVRLEQCITYAAELSKALIKYFGNRFLALDFVKDIEAMKAFVNNIFSIVRFRYEAHTLENDSAILDVIQTALLNDRTLKLAETIRTDNILSKNIAFIPTNIENNDFGITEFFEEPIVKEMPLEPAFCFSSPELQCFLEPQSPIEDLSPCFKAYSPARARKKLDEGNFTLITSSQPNIGKGAIGTFGIFSYIAE